MKYVYLLLFVLLPSFLIAQPTIQSMDNFSAGQKFIYVECNPSGVDPSTGGANNHWLFSALSSIDTMTQTIASPGATSYATQYPTANIAALNSDGRYLFYNQTSSKSFFEGFVDTPSNVQVVYSNTAISAVRPIDYNDSYTDTIAGTLNAGGYTFTGGGTAEVTADAWGMLHLPDNAYLDVLRIKTVINETDSNTSGPVPLYVTTHTTRYSWYSNSFPSALLTWDSTNISGAASYNIKKVYYMVDETIGVQAIASNHIKLAAAFNGSQLILNGKFDNGKQYEVSVSNLTGQKLYNGQFTGNLNRISLGMNADIPAGIYIISVRSNTGQSGVFKAVKN